MRGVAVAILQLEWFQNPLGVMLNKCFYSKMCMKIRQASNQMPVFFRGIITAVERLRRIVCTGYSEAELQRLQ